MDRRFVAYVIIAPAVALVSLTLSFMFFWPLALYSWRYWFQ